MVSLKEELKCFTTEPQLSHSVRSVVFGNIQADVCGVQLLHSVRDVVFGNIQADVCIAPIPLVQICF